MNIYLKRSDLLTLVEEIIKREKSSKEASEYRTEQKEEITKSLSEDDHKDDE